LPSRFEEVLNPLIDAKVYAAFDQKSPAGSLPDIAVGLLNEQKKSWPQLTAGYASLDSVQLREIQCTGYPVWLQFNPGRIVSTGAKVDDKSIRERPCFLCAENLPQEQKGILYAEEFLLLCNPAPIFREHFTISHVHHIPQLFSSFALKFLELARDLSPRYTVFYNGPKCGASAPDHMHFQASPAGTIPVENSAQEKGRRQHRKTVRNVDVFTLARFGRQAILLESQKIENLRSVLLDLIALLALVTGTAEEPMMNILCSYTQGAWRVILFPRSKHRPDAYFKEGDDRIVVSPAAVDIGGLIVTPIEKDFRTIERPTVESIFREVSLSDKKVEDAVGRLSKQQLIF
jgi:hypothetical protein